MDKAAFISYYLFTFIKIVTDIYNCFLLKLQQKLKLR